jgi:hypothetical protein
VDHGGFAGVFKRGCGKSACFRVVFLWCERGGVCRKRGVVTACFQGLKTRHEFQLYFSCG